MGSPSLNYSKFSDQKSAHAVLSKSPPLFGYRSLQDFFRQISFTENVYVANCVPKLLQSGEFDPSDFDANFDSETFYEQEIVELHPYNLPSPDKVTITEFLNYCSSALMVGANKLKALDENFFEGKSIKDQVIPDLLYDIMLHFEIPTDSQQNDKIEFLRARQFRHSPIIFVFDPEYDAVFNFPRSSLYIPFPYYFLNSKAINQAQSKFEKMMEDFSNVIAETFNNFLPAMSCDDVQDYCPEDFILEFSSYILNSNEWVKINRNPFSNIFFDPVSDYPTFIGMNYILYEIANYYSSEFSLDPEESTDETSEIDKIQQL